MKKVIDFMSVRYFAAFFSIALTILALGSIAFKGLAFGLDFTGGTLVELEYQTAPDLEKVRQELIAAGYTKLVVQNVGADTSVLVRLSQDFSDTVGHDVVNTLAKGGNQVKLNRAEFVGSQVGEELQEQGGLGLLASFGAILIYVAFRFQYKFGVGAIVATIHDVIITVGMFSWFQWDFDLTILAAVMAIIGYSLNDTIVVFDRVRENFRLIRKSSPVEVINISMTQTLSRTLVTSGTTLLAIIALYLFGGEMINGFAKAMLIGVAFGTYSSIYVASSMLLTMNIAKEDLMPPVVPEGEGPIDEMP